MFRLATLLGGLVLLAVCVGVQSAQAQGLYRPAKPTISPWLNLYDRRAGPLGGYLSDVRPRMEAYQALGQQQKAIARQGEDIQLLGQQVTDIRQEGAIAPTGTGAGFMTHAGHFQTSGGGRAAAPRRGTWSPPPSHSYGRGMRSMSGMSGLYR
jgi:hypothetical protein